MPTTNVRLTGLVTAAAAAAVLFCATGVAHAGGDRVKLDASMVTNELDKGEPQNLVDEQSAVSDPPAGAPATTWTVPSQHWKAGPPASMSIDLGQERHLSSLWFYDLNGAGDITIAAGTPGAWTDVTTYDCKAYKKWVEVPLNVTSRYVRLTRKDGGSNVGEIALYALSPEAFAAAEAKRAADLRAVQEKEAAMAKARAEVANRPVVNLGDPFGDVILVDEVNAAAEDPGHRFAQDPPEASRVETILGKPARVLNKTPGEAAYVRFRVGENKLLKAGGAYVLEIEYPEDEPRGVIVLNSGNESSRGFHTGAALGDAFHPKYVNNLSESVATPLSKQYRTWTMFFNLHDRFADAEYVRGDGERPLAVDDGFTVTIAQFSAENSPMSAGAAVSRVRLYEVPDPAKLRAKYTLPPDGLPRRHLFWREEMADNAIQADKSGQPGVAQPIDWYRFKANQMEFLGFNTYSKDLLEFGANQHWDSSAHGGNDWVFFNAKQKDLWGQIVGLMGERGFDVMPYYEYAGSKGYKGLGPQRRAKPLTRDDAYTHIKWVENANADITDPETYEDFKKMLDATVVRQKDKAKFAGAWLRPRSQIPMGFGDATRKRFADEANGGRAVTRAQLTDDTELLGRYKQWWFGKRREFLVAVRDYLRENGIEGATVLYTAAAGEPGVSFDTWDDIMVTDDVDGWKKLLQETGNEKDAKKQVLSVDDVASTGMYLKALTAEVKTWGGWEWQHASPPPDPANYKETEGVLMTHAVNRLYTVASPDTFDLFRAPTGLALLRYYSLNENMMFDKQDKPKLGYFCADFERAGPYSMMAEAMAMANGDPTHLGYLHGRVFARGFPKYVRDFNTAFLSLPALPSKRLDGASSDAAVVVRSIATDKHGTYVAVVNTAMTGKEAVTVDLPSGATVTDAATGEPLATEGGKLRLTLYPYQLRAVRVQ